MKSLKLAQKIALIITLLIGLFLIIHYWYNNNYSVEIIRPDEGSIHKIDRKLLIATQGSPFKDSVVAVISEHYKSFPIEVEVIDVRLLSNKDVEDFDVIFIMYRWEAGAPPEVVQSFMEKNLNLKDKILVMSTSWNGLEKVKNIDAITGASIVQNVPIITSKIIKRIDRLLK